MSDCSLSTVVRLCGAGCRAVLDTGRGGRWGGAGRGTTAAARGRGAAGARRGGRGSAEIGVRSKLIPVSRQLTEVSTAALRPASLTVEATADSLVAASQQTGM